MEGQSHPGPAAHSISDEGPDVVGPLDHLFTLLACAPPALN